MRRLALLVLVVLLAGLLGVAGPVQAHDQKDLQISPDNPVHERDYEGGAALYVGNTAGENKGHSPQICRVAEYCDTIDLDITVPAGYTQDWALRITLLWAAGPDLDMTLYNSQEVHIARAWTAANPEIITLKFMEPGRYYITVVQFDDILVVYKLRAEFLPLKPVEPRKRSTSSAEFSSGSSPGSFREPPAEGGFGTGAYGARPLFPVGELPSTLQPVAVDIPGGEEGAAKSVGFSPLDDEKIKLTSFSFDGQRLSLGVVIVAVIGLVSYLLFFVRRRVPARKTVQAA